MSNLALFPLDAGSKPTVMETIMKPLSYAARPARWLMAAGLALAAMHAPQASAQTTELSGGLNIERGGHPNPPRGEAEPFFEKTGVQRDCDYVVYNLRFGARRSSPIRTLRLACRTCGWTSATRCRLGSRSSTSRRPAMAPMPSAVRFLPRPSRRASTRTTRPRLATSA